MFHRLPHEHYAGNFPLWLASEQVRVLPVTEAQMDYAKGIVNELRSQQVRAALEFSNDKLMGRIQRAEEARVHHILVVGQKEQDGPIRVRLGSHDGGPGRERNSHGTDVLSHGGGFLVEARFVACGSPITTPRTITTARSATSSS